MGCGSGAQKRYARHHFLALKCSLPPYCTHLPTSEKVCKRLNSADPTKCLPVAEWRISHLIQ